MFLQTKCFGDYGIVTGFYGKALGENVQFWQLKCGCSPGIGTAMAIASNLQDGEMGETADGWSERIAHSAKFYNVKTVNRTYDVQIVNFFSIINCYLTAICYLCHKFPRGVCKRVEESGVALMERKEKSVYNGACFLIT